EGRHGRYDRLSALLAVERKEELAAQVLCLAERPQRVAAQELGGGGIGAQEERRAGGHRSPGDQVVDGDVVAAEAPRPGPVSRRIAEDADVVEAWVAAPLAAPAQGPALDLVQDVL